MQHDSDHSDDATAGLDGPKTGNAHVSHKKHGHQSHGPAHHEEGEEGEGPWLLSYADMVTLLMCFFILFFSVEKNEKQVQSQKSEARLKSIIQAANEEVNDEAIQSQAQDQVASSLDVAFALGYTEPNTIELVLLASSMFQPGLAKLTSNGVAAVQAVVANIKMLDKKSLVEVEGHTDASPVSNSKFADNWELSTSRATSVVRVLIQNGIEPERIRASGKAHFQPLAPEKDDRGFALLANQALNRRVVVRLKLPPKDAPPVSPETPKTPLKSPPKSP